jgi:hypothetical protein
VAKQPTKTVKRLIHKLEHLFGWNGGRVETWYSMSGCLMVGFRCAGCGKLEGIHPARRICQKGAA